MTTTPVNVPGDVYMSNQRSNSVSSFNSCNSNSNLSTISTITSSHAVPRGSSTNDLLSLDTMFTRPSRHKVNHQYFRPNPSSTRSLTGYAAAPRIPRSSSVPSVPKLNTIAPQNHQSSLPTNSHPGLRTSTSMHHVPAYRRQSLKTAHQYINSSATPSMTSQSGAAQAQIQHQQQQQHRQHHHQQPPQKRRASARPGFHNAPFTFPNGEVYTPRNKQRSSQTNLKALPQIQNSNSFQGNSSSASLTPRPQHHQQHQQPLSFSASQASRQADPVLLQQPLQQQHSNQENLAATTTESFHSHQSQPPTDQDHSLLSTKSNSFSSSPSPSRTSGTNSSVNESTPPSSIDDLTLHITNNKLDVCQLPPPLQSSSNGVDPCSQPNLGKIEEHESKTSNSTPTSDCTQKTIKCSDEAAEEAVDPMEPDHRFLELQAKARAQSQQKAVEPAPAPAPAPTTININTNAPKPTPLPASPAPVATVEPVQRKQSVLKRFFSKVFSSSDKSQKSTTRRSLKKKSSQATLSMATSKITPKVNVLKRAQTSPEPAPQVKPSQVETAVPTQAPKAFNQPMTKNTLEMENSDSFSFIDGDEDEGIKIESQSSSTSDFKSELVLDKLFSRLTTNESSEEIFKKISDEKKDSGALDKKKKTGDGNQQNAGHDAEDYIIQFDDVDFIDKIIEYGETPFPNLKATDLGQSERKLQRSKSIERKKSLRSISSNSRQLDEVMSQSENDVEVGRIITKNPHLEIIYSNQPKDPFPMIKSRPSILKKKSHSFNTPPSKNSSSSTINSKDLHNRSESLTSPTKKVGFTNQIFVNNTYPSYIYNRHSRSLSSYSLSPQLIQQIRYEMNDFKRSMPIHDSSKGNTHFFRA